MFLFIAYSKKSKGFIKLCNKRTQSRSFSPKISSLDEKDVFYQNSVKVFIHNCPLKNWLCVNSISTKFPRVNTSKEIFLTQKSSLSYRVDYCAPHDRVNPVFPCWFRLILYNSRNMSRVGERNAFLVRRANGTFRARTRQCKRESS